MADTRTTSIIGALQPLGRALMLPIAVLPVAGLLLRLGQPDLFGLPFIAAAGDAIFHNLGLLFAIGVAVGFAKDSNGAAGLAGVVCFLVATEGAKSLIHAPPEVIAGLAGKTLDLTVGDFRSATLNKLGVPIGILSGLIGGNFYNRFGTIKLPDYLAFFGGRRFVPIASGLAGLGLAFVFGASWSVLNNGIESLSRAVVAAGPLGLFIYGVLNRLLIVTGLHHILNNVAWFVLGDYHGATGDLHRFFAGDPTAGGFMAGYFPVMMFGLPAACLAMYHTALPERRKAAGGLLISLALTAFLTGVTEPIEFSFMFLAPVLFAIHAVLTGASMALMDLLGVKLGFGFSAGAFDYVLNYKLATKPWMLGPVGLGYFALYYGLFRFFILRFDLKTPGREVEETPALTPAATAGGRGEAFIAALGGGANLVSIDACTTRLRLVVADQAGVSESGLKALGARGFIRPSARDLQVVLGPIADDVAREMRDSHRAAPRPAAGAPAVSQAAGLPIAEPRDSRALLAALGGSGNLKTVTACSSRLRLELASLAAIDEPELRRLGARGLVRCAPDRLHVILGPDAEAFAADLKARLAS